MVKHTPYSIIVTYAEDRQQLIVQAVDPARLTTIVAGKLEMPILLDEFDFKLDDAFARRLGAAMLSLIALGQPDIKQYMSMTYDPIDQASRQFGEGIKLSFVVAVTPIAVGRDAPRNS